MSHRTHARVSQCCAIYRKKHVNVLQFSSAFLSLVHTHINTHTHMHAHTNTNTHTHRAPQLMLTGCSAMTSVFRQCSTRVQTTQSTDSLVAITVVSAQCGVESLCVQTQTRQNAVAVLSACQRALKM